MGSENINSFVLDIIHIIDDEVEQSSHTYYGIKDYFESIAYCLAYVYSIGSVP